MVFADRAGTSPAIDPVREFLNRWTQVVVRDLEATFIIGVTTTGIYCRVGCPSRLPRPQNVRFFETTNDAREHGFRACKRCQPDADSGGAEQRALVKRACRLIEETPGARSAESLAAELGLSASHFQRLFTQIAGVTPKAYDDAVRARRLRESLELGSDVTTAIHTAGYGSSSRVYERSDAVLGMRPGQLRNGGNGVAIRMTTAQCSLGWVLVAATDRGICGITLGDDPAALEDEFRGRFPLAVHSEGDETFRTLVQQVVDLVDRPGIGHDLPLDIQGTAFQQRVWQALMRIPAGQTRTYQQIATEIGQPTATRAVGAACGANKIAVAIPCHRAVGSTGSLTGYRWGVERKRELLAKERSAISDQQSAASDAHARLF